MKRKKGFRGIRKRWMVNSISVVLFIVLLAVSAFSAAMGSYYYSTLSESLSQKAENAVQSFNYFQSGGSYYDYARSMVSGDPSGDRLEVGGIALELSAQKVYVNHKQVALTPKEFSLLRCLMQNKNMVMSREQLLVKCWGYDYEGESRAVDTHIKRLREKLGEQARCIKTVIKSGYKLEV